MINKEIEKAFKEFYHETLGETIDFDIDSHQDYVDLFVPFAKGYICASSKLKAENEKLERNLKNADHLLSRYVDETMEEIKFPYFDDVRCNLFRLYGYYKKELEGEK